MVASLGRARLISGSRRDRLSERLRELARGAHARLVTDLCAADLQRDGPAQAEPLDRHGSDRGEVELVEEALDYCTRICRRQ